MRLAIVGALGAGKTTLFRAFTGQTGPQGDAAPSGAGPAVAVVKVRDPRLETLRERWNPRKYTPIAVTVQDFPGIPDRGETSGMKLGELLAAAREADGLIVCVRAFECDSYPYKRAAPDPLREAEDVVDELAFADLDQAVRRIEKLEKKRGNMTDDEKREHAALVRVRSALEEGRAVKSVEIPEADKKLLRGFRFLTDKPWVLAVSMPDDGGDATVAEKVQGPFEARIALRARLEAEVSELEPDDRAAFMKDLGIESLASESLLRAAFTALGTISFFTSGEDEVRAWPIPRGANAVEAAGKIHSDLARGFIRAEVYSYDDFVAAGLDEAAVKKAGKFRVEGREYVVRDGDVVNIRFSV
ncbi:MAG: Ribosome-binding ATPase YchF [Planctomycetes bacterium]|nr:Ribosome-binding ATPase YchF [Planctomycetota bacterium]